MLPALNGEGCTCFEPEKHHVLERCANPLRPASGWRRRRGTDVHGDLREAVISLRITVSPLDSEYFSNLISGSAARAANASATINRCDPAHLVLRKDPVP